MPDEARPSGPLPARVVAIGASAGGLPPLIDIVSALPGDLDAAVLVVVHMSPTAHSALPVILDRHTQLRVAAAQDGERLVPGHVYVAVPDHHLTVESDHIRVTRGPSQSGYRPAIDTLFRSAARWWTDRALAVVLSGALDDGAVGVTIVQREGGVALAQDPESAEVRDMPAAALATGAIAAALRPEELARCITKVAGTMATAADRETGPRPTTNDALARESDGDQAPAGVEARPLPEGSVPSGFSCPNCGGGLFELPGAPLRYRCWVGHGWTTESLHAAHDQGVEEALWTALRVLEEDLALQQRMLERARAGNRAHAQARIERRVAERQRLLGTLRDLVAYRPDEGAAEPRDTPNSTADRDIAR